MISNKSASKLQSCPSPQGGTNPYSRPLSLMIQFSSPFSRPPPSAAAAMGGIKRQQEAGEAFHLISQELECTCTLRSGRFPTRRCHPVGDARACCKAGGCLSVFRLFEFIAGHTHRHTQEHTMLGSNKLRVTLLISYTIKIIGISSIGGVKLILVQGPHEGKSIPKRVGPVKLQ